MGKVLKEMTNLRSKLIKLSFVKLSTEKSWVAVRIEWQGIESELVKVRTLVKSLLDDENVGEAVKTTKPDNASQLYCTDKVKHLFTG